MGSVGRVEKVESWRTTDERYMRKTSGGVYFYSSRSWEDIDAKMYARLPKAMQDAVINLENTKTMDGNHASIYYVSSSGVIEYFDEYGLGDFYYAIRHTPKSELGKVSDWQYDGGQWSVGDQLKRRK